MYESIFRRLRLGFWQWIFLILLAGGAYASLVSAMRGSGRVGQVSHTFTASLSSGLIAGCGLALAVGAFSIAAFLYYSDWRGVAWIRRATLLIAPLGYLAAALASISGLERIGQIGLLILAPWNTRSIQAGLGWYLLVIAALLAMEFAPGRCSVSGWHPSPSGRRFVGLLLAALAALVAMLHELALLRPILLAPERFSPLWATPELPVLFFFSGVCACLAVAVFSARNRKSVAEVSDTQLSNVGRWLAAMLWLYLLLRLNDFLQRGIVYQLVPTGTENYLLGLELALLLLPIFLLGGKGAENTARIIAAADITIAGVMTNRLNTLITATEGGPQYFPAPEEMLIALSIAAAAVAGFTVAAKRWNVFGTLENGFGDDVVPQDVAALLPSGSRYGN